MFTKKDVYELDQNVFQEIGKNWVLISAKNPEGKVNAMTASWGAMGVLWGMETITVYIRQTRYTKEFVDSQEHFTVSLFDGYKKELRILGSKSGRDGDKIGEAGFTLEMIEDQPAFQQSKCVFICKKLYQDDIPMDAMPEDVRERWYADGNYHTMYIAQIVGCYVNEQ